MSRTKPKTKYLAEISLQEFVHQNEGHCYWWTFTEPGRRDDPLPSCPIQRQARESFIGPLQIYWTKDEAEEHFKAFRDLCRRMGWKCIIVWEQQKRGSWHPHLFVNHYIDVNFLRDFMVKRGWGPQMRAERLDRHRKWIGYRWVTVKGETSKRMNYAIKYLGKDIEDDSCKRKKRFSCVGLKSEGRYSVKKGSVDFKWNPHFRDQPDEKNPSPSRPGAYLFAMGAPGFARRYGHWPTFRDIAETIWIGSLATNWSDYDPWWEMGFAPGSFAGLKHQSFDLG